MDIHVFGQIDSHSWWILSTSCQKTKDLGGKKILGGVTRKPLHQTHVHIYLGTQSCCVYLVDGRG